MFDVKILRGHQNLNLLCVPRNNGTFCNRWSVLTEIFKNSRARDLFGSNTSVVRYQQRAGKRFIWVQRVCFAFPTILLYVEYVVYMSRYCLGWLMKLISNWLIFTIWFYLKLTIDATILYTKDAGRVLSCPLLTKSLTPVDWHPPLGCVEWSSLGYHGIWAGQCVRRG